MAAILRHVTIHGALCHGLPRFQVCLMLVTAQVLGHCGEQVSEAAARPAAYTTGDGRVQLMAPAPCALPDVRRPFASVVPAAGEAGQVAAAGVVVRQVEELAGEAYRPPGERLAADGAGVAGPV